MAPTSPSCSAKELYDIRTPVRCDVSGRRFVRVDEPLRQHPRFPLREHTKKKEGEIRDIVMEKLEMVGSWRG